MNAESKSERFKRLAVNRTNKIIDLIRLLGNCSNTATYEYSSEEVNKIFNAIESELKQAKQKFQSSSSSKRFEL